MPVELDPRVRNFQAIKAERKAQKIKEVEAIAKIKAVSPQLSDKQAMQAYEAHLRQQQARTITIKGRKVKVFQAS